MRPEEEEQTGAIATVIVEMGKPLVIRQGLMDVAVVTNFV